MSPPRPTPAIHDPSRVFGLDLLRAIAILLVLFTHWCGHFTAWFQIETPAWLEFAGDTGVDLFFVLSGFLIGRILLRIAPNPTWHAWRVFLIRRALRTLPLYFLWLSLLLVLAPPRHDAAAIALRFLTMTQNLVAPMPPDYYFAVTWSLAIEEWFYLLFSAALLGLAACVNRNWALVTCLGGFMLIPLLLRLGTPGVHETVFFRIDEIGYGVAAAALYLNRHWMFDTPGPLCLLGFGLIESAALATGIVPAWVSQVFGHVAVVIGCACCLPAALRLTTIAPWFDRPVRWIAARSYALYVVHLTILVDVVEAQFWETGMLSTAQSVTLAVIAPFPLAALSWRVLEAPMLRLRPSQAQDPTYPAPNAPDGLRASEAGKPYYPSVAA